MISRTFWSVIRYGRVGAGAPIASRVVGAPSLTPVPAGR